MMIKNIVSHNVTFYDHRIFLVERKHSNLHSLMSFDSLQNLGEKGILN